MKRIPKKTTVTALLMAFLLLACPRRFSDSGKAVVAVSRMNLGEAGGDEETVSAPLPQTVVYDIVADFLAEPLPEGKSAKKVLLMGYDGFRRDGLVHICDAENGAVCRVSEQGGLYDTYAGGAAGIDIQATSTAPGWVSILTGQWSGYTGVTDNGQIKRVRPRSTSGQRGRTIRRRWRWPLTQRTAIMRLTGPFPV